jgi:hypothetical protein
MLKPTTVEFREKLKPKRITARELLELLNVVTSDAKTVRIDAEWPRGQRARSEDTSLLHDIYNPQELQSLDIWVYFDDDSHLHFDLMSFRQLSANKGRGLERARQVHAHYEGIPSRRAMVRIAGLLLLVAVAAIALLGLSLISRRAFNQTDFMTVLGFPAFGTVVILYILMWPALWLWGKMLPGRTTVVPDATPWFRNPAVWSAASGSIIAAVALLTFITNRW